MYKKILVPLDGSELAEKALDHAEELARAFDAEIILFQVVLMPIYGAPELVTPVAVGNKQKEAAERYLTYLCRGFEKERPQGYSENEDRFAGGRRDYRLRKGKRSRFDRDVHPRSFGNYSVGFGECCAQSFNTG